MLHISTRHGYRQAALESNAKLKRKKAKVKIRSLSLNQIKESKRSFVRPFAFLILPSAF
jgi:hypothetical protein